MNNELLDYPGYIFRGHGQEIWLLEPTLDRFIKSLGKTNDETFQEELLEEFKKSTRGRLGYERSSMEEKDWWALGQHHGLKTPLLDWTYSPYIAAFFAYNEEIKEKKNVAIWALQEKHVIWKSDEIKAAKRDQKSNFGPVELIHPNTDENPRLVSQAGLFTWSPLLVDIEKWVRANFKGESEKTILFKILIPQSDREMALKSLNRMHINYLSLFPDREGSSKHCNMKFSIDAY